MSIGFNLAMKEVLELEGGYNNIPQDQGGATNYGISLRFLRNLRIEEADINGDGHVDKEDIKALEEEDAELFYRTYFWNFYKLEQFGSTDLQIKLFGMYVNMRAKTVGKCLQRALRAQGCDLVEDGLVGPATRAAANEADLDMLMAALRSEQAAIYRLICAANPSQEVFLKGWLRRAYR